MARPCQWDAGVVLEVTQLEPSKFGNVKSEDATLPLQELLEWAVAHPYTGYKGGIARLVGKILWLDSENPDLTSEIAGFNDIDLIYFLQDGEEHKKDEMKALVDQGLTIGGIPVEAQDVEYSYDTVGNILATRDLTQNQCIVVSDGDGKVFLINAKICRDLAFVCRGSLVGAACRLVHESKLLWSLREFLFTRMVGLN